MGPFVSMKGARIAPTRVDQGRKTVRSSNFSLGKAQKSNLKLELRTGHDTIVLSREEIRK